LKLDDNHLYHGGALIQIAEHDKFTAINVLKIGQKNIKTRIELMTMPPFILNIHQIQREIILNTVSHSLKIT